MEPKYWLLAVVVMVAMSYASVEGAFGANCTEDMLRNGECAAKGYSDACQTNQDCQLGNVGANAICKNSMCDCMDGYSWKTDMCKAKGYNDTCTADADCQLGKLEDKGACSNTTNTCDCMDGFTWEEDICNDAAGLAISITLMLGVLLSKTTL
ncbi:uncharacterized protein LOC128205930 [Mya arenaria]|nr:uncharacterized protein LOC128205930 [Mya arenaria]